MSQSEYSHKKKKTVDEKQLIKYLNTFLEDLLKKEVEIKEKVLLKQEKLDNLLYEEKEINDSVDKIEYLFSPAGAKLESKKQEYFQEIEREKTELAVLKKEYEEVTLSYNKVREIYEYLAHHIHLENKEVKKNNPENKQFEMYISDEELGLQLLETQEFERKRIARDLHDSTVQNLTNIVHKTELCLKLISIDTVRAKLELQTLTDNVRSIIDDMRSIIYDLRPMSIDDLGLVTTIERFINQITINRDIEIYFNKEGDEANLLPVVNLTLFRIVQEACNNAIKHANATKIFIRLIYQNQLIKLNIKDNGCGFKDEKEYDYLGNQIPSFGLSIMKERVYLLKGEININSKLKKGTEIRVEVPINQQMEERHDTN